MSDNMNSKRVALFGVGRMGLEYVKVLRSLGVQIAIVVGRSQQGIDAFEAQCGIQALPYSSKQWESVCLSGIDCAIVAVSIQQLAPVTSRLIDMGIRKILLEKPGALNLSELKKIELKAVAESIDIFLAYNRRFYASVERAREMIIEDGGVRSFCFEFTEWSHRLEASPDDPRVKQRWFLVNSSHVVDLAFCLGGKPQEIKCYTMSGLPWHSSACVFAGAGQTKEGILFSYHANWDAPGRWGVECLTANRRLILRPLEHLYVQKKESIAIEPVEMDADLDRTFKPGLYCQTEAFLREEYARLKRLSEQVEDMSLYYKMAGYSDR